MQVLTYPKGTTAALRTTGVRDQHGTLVSDAELRVTLTTIAGAAVTGATDQVMLPVEGEAGAYEWVAPHGLNLDGQYRWQIVATSDTGYTPLEGLLWVVPAAGADLQLLDLSTGIGSEAAPYALTAATAADAPIPTLYPGIDHTFRFWADQLRTDGHGREPASGLELRVFLASSADATEPDIHAELDWVCGQRELRARDEVADYVAVCTGAKITTHLVESEPSFVGRTIYRIRLVGGVIADVLPYQVAGRLVRSA